MEDLPLARLDGIKRAIQTATTVQEIKGNLDVLAAAKVYSQQQRATRDVQLKVAEYIVRAERRLGEILEAAKKAGQITHAHDPRHKPVVDSDDNRSTTLKEIGITRDLSSRSQKIADIPEQEFEKRITEQKATGKPSKLSPSSIINFGRETCPEEHAREVIRLHDEKVASFDIAAKIGITERWVQHIIERENVRRDGERNGKIQMAAETLSLSAQQKLTRAIEREKERLGKEFKMIVDAEIERRLKNLSASLQAEQDQAKRIMQRRHGFMTKGIFRKIRACLHADWVTDEKQKRRYDEAFNEFNKLEKFILDEKESPTDFIDIPRTRAEWDAMKTARPQKVGKNEII
jgi:hypothetical protein